MTRWWMLCAFFLLSHRKQQFVSAFSSILVNKSSTFQSRRVFSVQSMSSTGEAKPEASGRGSFPAAQAEAVSSTSSSGLVPWLERIAKSIAKSRRIKGGNYVQIATVDAETRLPHCRTVVFRGFLKNPPPGLGSKTFMKMITDARSDKVKQIQADNNCELLWWFSESSEQYRVRGKLLLAGEEEGGAAFAQDRLDTWKGLSDPAREQFFWPPPGPFATVDPASIPTGGRDSSGVIVPPPANFLLMLLVPAQIKYLRLRDNLAILDERAKAAEPVEADAEAWTVSRINP